MRSRYLILIVLFLLLFNGYLIFRALVPRQPIVVPTPTPAPSSRQSNGYDKIVIVSKVDNVKQPQLTQLNNVYYALQSTNIWVNGAYYIPSKRRVPVEHIEIRLVKENQYVVLAKKPGATTPSQSFGQEYHPPTKTLRINLHIDPTYYADRDHGSLVVSNAASQALFQSAIENPNDPKDNAIWTKAWNEYTKRMGEAFSQFVKIP